MAVWGQAIAAPNSAGGSGASLRQGSVKWETTGGGKAACCRAPEPSEGDAGHSVTDCNKQGRVMPLLEVMPFI